MPGSLSGGGAHPAQGLAEGAMDEDGNALKRFRLTTSFGELDDPVEGNPFPPEHPAHRAWQRATRIAQVEICRISADASSSSDAASSLTVDNAGEWMQTMVVAKFDVWAERGLQAV